MLGLAVAGVVIFNLVYLMTPPLLDYIMPLNQSHQKKFPFKAEFPFDPYQYYYEVWIYYEVGTFMLVSLGLSADSTFITFVHHNLGIFAVTR